MIRCAVFIGVCLIPLNHSGQGRDLSRCGSKAIDLVLLHAWSTVAVWSGRMFRWGLLACTDQTQRLRFGIAAEIAKPLEVSGCLQQI